MGSDRPLGENPLSLSENDLGTKEIKHENPKEIINRTERGDRTPVVNRVVPALESALAATKAPKAGAPNHWMLRGRRHNAPLTVKRHSP